jgi:hypothetical protein
VNKIRTYSELKQINLFENRFNYLKLVGHIGEETFGFDRYLNQMLYRSRRWRSLREKIILRDEGCDLACLGYIIHNGLIIHHMNPISIEDIESDNNDIFDPEFLITTSSRTHRAIHYGDESLLEKPPVIRQLNDTVPWK